MIKDLEEPKQATTALFVKMAVTAWETQNGRLNKLLAKLSDEELSAQISPGRNSGIYLLGHLTAISDAMLPLLGFGEKLYPELTAIFITNPDRSGLEMPAAALLRKYWDEVNVRLTQHINGIEPGGWFARHNSVSDADFAKEPQRNKLNVLISRTNHLSYHLGQMILL